VCYRADKPFAINGVLDKRPWLGVPWTEPFLDIEGIRKALPAFQTRVKMLWDDEFLYIAAQLEEPHVWGTLTERDSVIFQDNDFEVFIDPDGDGHYYGELEINALGTVWDLLLPQPYKDGGRALTGWRFRGLKSAVAVDGTLNDPSDIDRGWSVELALPWSDLAEIASGHFPPVHGDQWRLNFSRVEWDLEVVGGRYQKVPGRAEHNWVWSPQGVVDMHRPENWGYLQFSSNQVGADVFVEDPHLEVKETLYRIYYRLHDFKKAHGRWAGLSELSSPSGVRLDTTMSTFELVLDGWHLAGNGRIWREPISIGD